MEKVLRNLPKQPPKIAKFITLEILPTTFAELLEKEKFSHVTMSMITFKLKHSLQAFRRTIKISQDLLRSHMIY